MIYNEKETKKGMRKNKIKKWIKQDFIKLSREGKNYPAL